MSQSNLITNDSDNHTTERGVPMTRIRIDDLPIAEELTPEQEALILGAGLKSFRPSLEALEARDVPALIAPGIDLTGTTLTFQAAPSSQRGYFSSYGGTAWINDANQVVAQRIVPTGPTGSSRLDDPVFLDRSQVTNIVFQGGFGKDTFTNNTGIPSSARSLNSGEGDTHVRFSMTGPSVLPPESASGESAVWGVRVGNNTAPDLRFENLPADTATLDLSLVDHSAPTNRFPSGRFTHMELSNIPASVRSLQEALDDPRTIKGDGYYGPNPTNGREHTYVWTLTARDAAGRVIGQTEFRSTFQYEPGAPRTDSGWTPPSA